VVYRRDACAHLRLAAGRCFAATSTDEVVVSRRTAGERHWAPGDRILVELPAQGTNRPMRVVGVYEPADPGGAYWFNDTRHYFGGTGERRAAPTNPPTVEALLAAEPAFGDLANAPAGTVTAVLSLPFDRTGLHPADVPALRAQLDRFGTGLISAGADQHGFGGAVVTHLRDLLDRADTGRNSLRLPMLLVVGQLLLLGWYVLFMVAAGAAEARGGEVALAKVRGLPAGSTLAFGVVESALLLAAAVPAGVGVGLFAVRALAGRVFGPDTLVGFPAAAWVAAGVAAAGGLVAAGLGGVATFRRPVLVQWRRAQREPGGRSAVADAVVFALALAGLGELWLGGSLASGRLDVLALAAPGLLALAGALLGARLLPPLARAGLAPTRASVWVGLFVALRQVARRPGGPRLVAVLATAFALATFSVLAWSVFAHNRHDRAAVETGADRVVTVDPYSGADLVSVVHRLDPGGTRAMAVLETGSAVVGAVSVDPGLSDGPSTAPLRLLAVEPDRLAAIGYWRGDFGDRSFASLAAGLSRPLPPALPVRGDALRLSATNTLTGPGAVGLRAELTATDGSALNVPLAPGPDGAYVAGVPCADSPCRLRAITVVRTAPGVYPAVGTLTVRAVEQRGAAGWQPVDGALDPARWQPANPHVPGLDAPVEKLSPGLTVAYAAPGQVQRIGAVVAGPDLIPAVVTAAYAPPGGTWRLSLGVPTGAPVDVDVTGVVRVLPRGGDASAMIGLDQLVAARPAGYADLLPNQVWLSAKAPADFPDRLAAAGITVTGVTSTAARERVLSHEGPALAVTLMLAGAAAAALLAAAGAVVNLHLLARRREFELAAMRTLGVGRLSLAAAVAVEQVILVGFAIALGVGLGVLGARLALPSIPEYADLPAYPALLARPDPWLVAGVAAGLAVLLAAALAVSGYALLRAAVPTRLREAQA
jgi:hypothetical protein